MASQQEQALRRMLKLTNTLLSRSDSTPFREPVDWRGLELWDYPKIVKKMMDLGTVKRKLERGVYQTHEECAEDIRLIWHNCQLYNEEESDFFYLSKQFSKKFEDRYKKIQAEFGDAMDDFPASFSSSTAKKLPAKGSTSSSMDRKFKFSERLFRLNGNELGHVIQTFEQKCPHVLEDVASSGTSPQVEINVDQLPTAVFTELEAYVQSKIPNRKKRKLN